MPDVVLNFITELNPGGAERIVLDLVKKLDQERFIPLAGALDGRGEYARRIRSHGIEVLDLGACHLWQVNAVWRLRNLLRKHQVKLLHTHLLHASVVGRLAARPLGIPVVTTSHIVDRRSIWWHFLLDRMTSHWCGRIVCVSNAVREFQQKKTKIASTKYSVIHNGIDMSRFLRLPDKAVIRNKFNIPENSVLIGGLGRFERQKGFDVLLQAAAICKNPDIRFILGGYGPEENNLRRLSVELGLTERMIFAGYQHAAEDFLPALDIMVMPSRWEGMPMVLLESMASGLPVVASGINSISEVVEDGMQGILVTPDSPLELARGIERLAQNPDQRNSMGAAARIRAADFSIERMVAAYEDIYLHQIYNTDRAMTNK